MAAQYFFDWTLDVHIVPLVICYSSFIPHSGFLIPHSLVWWVFDPRVFMSFLRRQESISFFVQYFFDSTFDVECSVFTFVIGYSFGSPSLSSFLPPTTHNSQLIYFIPHSDFLIRHYSRRMPFSPCGLLPHSYIHLLSYSLTCSISLSA